MIRRAVLLGAGHAHLYALKRTAAFVRGGCELALVAPDTFWYSGLATGMLAGIYPPALDQVDVGALTAQGGGRFICASASQVDAAARTVSLDTGPRLSYDVVSCNLGSQVPVGSIPGAEAHGYAVKPVRNLWHLRQALEARLGASTPGQPLRVVVVGGGATACEIAVNIRRLVDDHQGTATITVLARGDTVLEQLPPGAAETMRHVLQRRGVELALRSPVVRVESQAVVTAEGRQVPYDFLVHAIGLMPPGLLRATGLPVSEEGPCWSIATCGPSPIPGSSAAGTALPCRDERCRASGSTPSARRRSSFTTCWLPWTADRCGPSSPSAASC